MLLTLATRSLASIISDSPRGEGTMTMLDLPDYAIRHLELRGLNVEASMLSGWSLEQLDRLRDRADKAGCPCLVLIEDTPLTFGGSSAKKRDAAADRVQRLAAAAHRLGCSAMSIACAGSDDEETFEQIASEVKNVMPEIERLELNVLLAPCEGLCHDPERLTELIKRIGGFRIGSLPSFGHAAATGDAAGTLRKLAPYAGAVHATVEGFNSKGEHKAWDLTECVSAIRSVGFVNTLAIDCISSKEPVADVERARTILEQAIEAEKK